jgi:putative oxidoreductase
VKKYLPFVVPVYAWSERYAYTVIRLVTGAMFIPHGVQKLTQGSIALGGLELIAGVLLVLGVVPRIMALLLALDVLWIISLNIGKGWLWTRGGVQYHVFLLGMLLAVIVAGGGWHAVMRSAKQQLVPVGYALARIWFALLILPSGYEKIFEGGAARIAAGNVLKAGFHPPLFWAWTVASLEFFGMMLLAVGLFTRPIAFAFAVQLGVITFMLQMPNGYFWTSRGMEFALALFLVCIAFVYGGGGRYSLDRRIGREF